MNQVNSKFTMRLENQQKAFEAIQSLHGKNYSWVDPAFVKATDLVTIMKQWRWSPSVDDGDNIVEIEFTGEKLGQDQIFFNAIAPYVEDGSFIEMKGSDDGHWKWSFENGKLKEYTAYYDVVWKEV